MTKDEFYNTIRDFDDLIDFCFSNGCRHIVEDLKHVDTFDDWVWDEVERLRPHWFWNELRDMLVRLDAPYSSYFRPTGTLEYVNIEDDDLEEFIDDVIVWGEEFDFWDPDDDEEEWILFGVPDQDGTDSKEAEADEVFVVASVLELDSLFT